MRSAVFVCLLLVLVGVAQANPPKAPNGFKWVRNWALSDEFNGNALNRNKWLNRHAFWYKRKPTIFKPEAISVGGGFLKIRSHNLKYPKDGYRIAGGAVMSKGYTAGFGYYEARMKANNIRMSSAFWMQNGMANLNATTNCNYDRYLMELDIVETVGGYNGKMSNHMASNTHYRHAACNGKGDRLPEKFYSAGAYLPLGVRTRDRFITYGAWWKDGNSVTFYADGRQGKTVWFRKDIDKTAPFDRKQALIMSSCTYDWLTPPTQQDLWNAQRSTTLYDWVRSWYLVRA